MSIFGSYLPNISLNLGNYSGMDFLGAPMVYSRPAPYVPEYPRVRREPREIRGGPTSGIMALDIDPHGRVGWEEAKEPGGGKTLGIGSLLESALTTAKDTVVSPIDTAKKAWEGPWEPEKFAGKFFNERFEKPASILPAMAIGAPAMAGLPLSMISNLAQQGLAWKQAKDLAGLKRGDPRYGIGSVNVGGFPVDYTIGPGLFGFDSVVSGALYDQHPEAIFSLLDSFQQAQAAAKAQNQSLVDVPRAEVWDADLAHEAPTGEELGWKGVPSSWTDTEASWDNPGGSDYDEYDELAEGGLVSKNKYSNGGFVSGGSKGTLADPGISVSEFLLLNNPFVAVHGQVSPAPIAKGELTAVPKSEHLPQAFVNIEQQPGSPDSSTVGTGLSLRLPGNNRLSYERKIPTGAGDYTDTVRANVHPFFAQASTTPRGERSLQAGFGGGNYGLNLRGGPYRQKGIGGFYNWQNPFGTGGNLMFTGHLQKDPYQKPSGEAVVRYNLPLWNRVTKPGGYFSGRFR